MAQWYDMPAVLPVHGQTVWCRRTSWISPPFQAVWDEAAQTFTQVTTGLWCYWDTVARWTPSTDPLPTSTLLVSGVSSPNRNGTYTFRGVFAGDSYYQRGSDMQFLVWVPTVPEWMLYQYVRNAVADRHSTKDCPNPTSFINTFAAYGTCTGSATVAWPT